jgi:hypothetical protein
MDGCHLRPSNDVEGDGLMRVTAEVTNFKIDEACGREDGRSSNGLLVSTIVYRRPVHFDLHNLQ